MGKSGEREAGASPQRSESEKRLETGRESDEEVGAVAQHATVPSEMRVRSSTETVGFGLLGDPYQSQFLGLSTCTGAGDLAWLEGR